MLACQSKPDMADKKSPYFMGTASESHKKTSAMQIHAATKKHQKCAAAVMADKAPPGAPRHHLRIHHHLRVLVSRGLYKAFTLLFLGTSQGERAFLQLSTLEKDHLLKLFNTSHAIAKNARPFSDLPWQLDLQSKNGVTLQNGYHNEKQCATFVTNIAQAELEVAKE